MTARMPMRESVVATTPRDQALAALGLADPATLEDVRRAFVSLSKTCHPDVAGNTATAQDRYREILTSYRLLKKQFKTQGAQDGPAGHEPHRRQAALFDQKTLYKQGFSRQAGLHNTHYATQNAPELSVADALERLARSRNPYLRAAAARALTGRLDRRGALTVLRLLGTEEHPEVCTAMVHALESSQTPLVRVSLRVYLMRRAGFRVRREFSERFHLGGLWKAIRDKTVTPREPAS